MSDAPDLARDLRAALDALNVQVGGYVYHQGSGTYFLRTHGERKSRCVYLGADVTGGAALVEVADACLGWAFAYAAQRGWRLSVSAEAEDADAEVYGPDFTPEGEPIRLGLGLHPASPEAAALRALHSAALLSPAPPAGARTAHKHYGTD